ncbi:hypothetical protein P0R31_36920 [Bradyrhizobium yuanmingense]|uniref:tetratricopeptide repeat protein n=1 Tax=Bradyrhizobium yuanmingense TaxID=108015 RepID=UPI0023B9BD82|nr:tetratricopeptide repeat protein [Bradyrhizobium yuanmingense]MDF0522821.1 hypothetical protein [Bradyrhizobium yuanmingense]
MFEVVGWSIVVAFVATTIATLLGLVGVLKIAPTYQGRLFTVLLLEIVAAGFFIFRQGLSPEQDYFREASDLYQRAVVARKNNDFQGADRLLGRILSLSPKSLPFEIRQVFRERGSLAYEEQNWEPAVKSYSVYFEIQPDDLDALVQYGRALRQTNRYEQAMAVYERAERLSSNNYDVLNGLQNITRRLGVSFNDAGRADIADTYFAKTRDYITRMLNVTGEADKTEPRYRSALLARSRLYWEWRKYPEAIAVYEKLVTDLPDFIPAQEDLAAVLLEAGESLGDQKRIATARDRYRQLYVDRPQGSDAVYNGAGFAEAAALSSDTSDAIVAEAEKAVLLSLAELKTAEIDPYPFYAAAVLFKRLGQNALALEYLRSAVRYERRRASDPFKFDHVRLIKYELLLQRWQFGG